MNHCHMKIKISTDYSKSPGPRYIVEGKNSGELFRTNRLLPLVVQAKSHATKVEINLDGTSGFGTSFLEESFGGLIRNDGFTLSELNNLLIFVSKEEPYLIDEIKEYMLEAEQNSARDRS